MAVKKMSTLSRIIAERDEAAKKKAVKKKPAKKKETTPGEE